MAKRVNKYQLYEKSVQDPKLQVDLALDFYKNIHKKTPYSLREDFCGTYMIACEWVKRDSKKTAIGLDLDSVPLNYGKKNHWTQLLPDQKKRVKTLKKNVISVTTPKVDVIMGCNFSFNIFKDYKTLVSYFRSARKSLKKDGIFSLEAAGGPGMIEELKERRRYQKNKEHWFTYVWHQKKYDPISNEGLYAIHFKMGDGRMIKDAFVYDWRMWTIPEIRMAMKEAGFKSSCVFWEDADEDGDGNGEWQNLKKAPNDHTWISYVIGVN